MTAWWALKPCGTAAAYRRHLRRGERPCEPCRQAEALRHAEHREREHDNAARRERYAAARAAGLNWRDALAARDRTRS